MPSNNNQIDYTPINLTRKKILVSLKTGAKTCRQLKFNLDCQWESTYYHLKILQEFDFITSEKTKTKGITVKEKDTTIYNLTDKGFKALQTFGE
jgi:predicted transcriptional regulator